MHEKRFIAAGKKLGESPKALVMLHGRGAGADDILSLSTYLNVSDFTLLAPQATGSSWYPYSFLAPPTSNEPWLSSAIEVLEELMTDIATAGVTDDHVYFVGFSQGACLALEFTARRARRYGGIAAFTGGLIGDRLYAERYKGDFAGTPVFIGTSNPDPHVPVERVKESVAILQQLNATVDLKIYNGMGHTINEDEIMMANEKVFGLH